MRLGAAISLFIISGCFINMPVGVSDLRNKPMTLIANYDLPNQKYSNQIAIYNEGSSFCPSLDGSVSAYTSGVKLVTAETGGQETVFTGPTYCARFFFTGDMGQNELNDDEPHVAIKDNFNSARVVFKGGYVPRTITIVNEKPSYNRGEQVTFQWNPSTDTIGTERGASISVIYADSATDSWQAQVDGSSLTTTISQSAVLGETILRFTHLLASPSVESCDFAQCNTTWSGWVEKSIVIE